MDKSSQKRPICEESDSSFDKECLGTPSKQPFISSESIVRVPSPEKAAKPEPSDSERNPSSDIEKSGLEILAIEASKMKYAMHSDHSYTKQTPYSPKFSENQVEVHSINKVSTANIRSTSIAQDQEDVWRAVSEKISRYSPEDASANKLENEYMVNYASIYTKELLFSIDVMTLVRYLNNLPCKWIIYVTSGEHPKSPCDDVLNEALGILWADIKDEYGIIFENHIKSNGIDYHRFQNIILRLAEQIEKHPYEEKGFLSYCVAIAHWAVHAERNGVTDAPEFVPLVICRTIQKLKDSGKIPSRFWDMIAEKAVDITCGVDKS